ncbi:MAG: TIGR02757 family protein [Ignavibacteriaceae bacterium]
MNLKDKLEYHYKAFDKSQISPDPLQFLHLFNDEKDIEVIGFIASLFAYGNVTQIINSLNKILLVAKNHPYDFVLNFSKKNSDSTFKNFKHRFYTSDDIQILFLMLHNVYLAHGSLKNLFTSFYEPTELSLKNSLNKFSKHFLELVKSKAPSNKLTLGLKFMFPLPELGSACKRMNLFLRWMVRKDELDFGLWSDLITPDKLIIPVDTHIARVCQSLRLTKRKNVSWLMAEEITSNLRKLDPADPVKYDFAICHIGMRKMKF